MSNADRIRAMDDVELTALLTLWATSPRAWQKDPSETLNWLCQQCEEGGDPT